MDGECDKTQVAIAVGEPLDGGRQAHLEGCGLCRALMEEYRTLQILVAEVDTPVPAGFADAVMAAVDAVEATRPDRWGERWAARLEGMTSAPVFRYLALGAAGGVSFASLVRFVLFVLIPG